MSISRKFFIFAVLVSIFFASSYVFSQQVDAPEQQPGKPPAEVRKLIQQEGSVNPDWWDSVQMNHPDTLDLTDKKKVKGWRPDIKIGAYIHSVVNVKQSHWKPAAKLMRHVIDVRRGDRQGQSIAMGQLAHIYFSLLCDYTHAAYWYEQKMRANKRVNYFEVCNLAECYWALGSKRLAMATLAKYQFTGRRPCYPAANLLAKMGELEKAVSVAESLTRSSRMADEGILAAANAYRNAGQLELAAQWYKKMDSLSKGSRYFKKNQTRAAQCLEAVNKMMQFDLSSIPDGEYDGSAVGYKGPVVMKITVTGGQITKVQTVSHREDKPHCNFTQLPGRIEQAGELAGVDAVSGATISSEAILNAAADALYKGAKSAGALKQ